MPAAGTTWGFQDQQISLDTGPNCISSIAPGIPGPLLGIFKHVSHQGLSDKEITCNARDIGNSGSILGWNDLLEKEVATHSSISCQENPMDREEPGRLQSIGSQSWT